MFINNRNKTDLFLIQSRVSLEFLSILKVKFSHTERNGYMFILNFFLNRLCQFWQNKWHIFTFTNEKLNSDTYNLPSSMSGKARAYGG